MGFSTILLTVTYIVIFALVSGVTYLVIHNYKTKKTRKDGFKTTH